MPRLVSRLRWPDEIRWPVWTFGWSSQGSYSCGPVSTGPWTEKRALRWWWYKLFIINGKESWPVLHFVQHWKRNNYANLINLASNKGCICRLRYLSQSGEGPIQQSFTSWSSFDIMAVSRKTRRFLWNNVKSIPIWRYKSKRACCCFRRILQIRRQSMLRNWFLSVQYTSTASFYSCDRVSLTKISW